MRICYVNPFFYPFHGGIERRIYNIAKRLAIDNEVYIVTSLLPGTKKYEEMENIKIIRLPSRFLNLYNPPFVWSKGIFETIRKLNPDIVDFHYRWAFDYTIAVHKLEGAKIFTFHNDFGEGVGIQKIFSYINDMIFKIFLEDFDRIICISNYVRSRLIKYGVDAQKLATIYNGIDAGKEEWNEKEDYILFVGRLVKTKGVDMLLRALKHADRRIKLKIVGTGPMLKKWHKMAIKYGINAEFLGWVKEDKKIMLMKKCRAFVLPSRYESFGIVLLEAMKYGAPVVALARGGIPEVVGDAGMVVENVVDMVEAIERLYEDDDMVRKYGKLGMERVKKFDWKELSRKTIKIYEDILAEK